MHTTTRSTGRSEALTSHRRVLAASPAEIFALLTDPREHAGLDATGSVRGVVAGPDRLELGAVFRMQMPGYKTTNTVVELEPDTCVAWRHRGRHVWRWELRAVEGGTEVTETFDYTDKRARALVRLLGLPTRAGRSIDATLVALEARFA